MVYIQILTSVSNVYLGFGMGVITIYARRESADCACGSASAEPLRLLPQGSSTTHTHTNTRHKTRCRLCSSFTSNTFRVRPQKCPGLSTATPRAESSKTSFYLGLPSGSPCKHQLDQYPRYPATLTIPHSHVRASSLSRQDPQYIYHRILPDRFVNS